MKKLINYCIFALFTLISFYVTEKTAVLLRNQDPLMENIKTYKESYDISPVNATIVDNYIIPGVSGQEIDEVKSLIKMRENNLFNELLIVTNQVMPEISLVDNLDKIIVKGNSKKKMVSIILESDRLINYFKDNKIEVSVLVDNNNFESVKYGELINNDYLNYKDVEKKLNNAKRNNNLCIINNNIEDICRKNNKYLVQVNKMLDNTNYIEVKNNLESGDIILVSDNTSYEYINLLIKYINSKNLKIVFLSKLIAE